MSSFRRGLVALFALLAVAATPVAAVASFHTQVSKISIVSVAHADEAPAPVASPAPGVGEKIGDAGDTIGGIADKIPMDGALIMVLAMIVGFVYDFLRRKFPTKNPASLWKDAKAILAGVKRLLLGLIKLVDKVDQVGDKVLGQNTK